MNNNIKLNNNNNNKTNVSMLIMYMDKFSISLCGYIS